MNYAEALLELREAGITAKGAHVSQEAANALAAFMARLVEDREVLLKTVGITEEEFTRTRRAAELLASVAGLNRKGTTK